MPKTTPESSPDDPTRPIDPSFTPSPFPTLSSEEEGFVFDKALAVLTGAVGLGVIAAVGITLERRRGRYRRRR